MTTSSDLTETAVIGGDKEAWAADRRAMAYALQCAWNDLCSDGSHPTDFVHTTKSGAQLRRPAYLWAEFVPESQFVGLVAAYLKDAPALLADIDAHAKRKQ